MAGFEICAFTGHKQPRLKASSILVLPPVLVVVMVVTGLSMEANLMCFLGRSKQPFLYPVGRPA